MVACGWPIAVSTNGEDTPWTRTSAHDAELVAFWVITARVNVNAVLDDLDLWYPLEEQPRQRPGRFYKNARVLFRSGESLTPQPVKIRLVVP
jgi:hypothetical protein